jgi:hypothetical protein
MNSTMETAGTPETDPGPEPTEQFLELPDGRIHYLDWGGDGLAAHFLHGNGFCAGSRLSDILLMISTFWPVMCAVTGAPISPELNASAIGTFLQKI